NSPKLNRSFGSAGVTPGWPRASNRRAACTGVSLVPTGNPSMTQRRSREMNLIVVDVGRKHGDVIDRVLQALQFEGSFVHKPPPDKPTTSSAAASSSIRTRPRHA